MKKILLVTDGLFHPPVFARKTLHQALAQLEGFSFEKIRSIEKLPSDLDSYQAIVLYLHHKQISGSALAKLTAFVTAGGGLLGVHSATASYKEAPQYFRILGGRFSGHGPVEKFLVSPVAHMEIFSDIPAFEVVDELYLHEFHQGIQVHFTADHQGEAVPAVWTNTFGQGRIFYAVAGHTTQTLKNRTYQKLLQQGLQWVTDR